ncbi:hypothetical protein [Chryseobacterium sp. JAH]|uniref:hypothetical protein n=1 Tax=Chryseobacterium sp. JAH TaxID=1742858 RepID=UPI000740D8DF|nr:hypothetical protein [Chryseobacterium sp. JAH]KUJ52275.1 hypothetical protein AR685_04435 [Chryseobacterium sp. JAH]
MFKKILTLFSIISLLISCKEECYTNPEPVVFEFINSQGENLIQNGSLPTFAIQEEPVNGISTGVELTKTADFKIKLEGVGSFSGTKKYRFFSTIKLFNFSIRSSAVTTECEGFKIDQIEFDSISSTKEINYYKIILD